MQLVINNRGFSIFLDVMRDFSNRKSNDNSVNREREFYSIDSSLVYDIELDKNNNLLLKKYTCKCGEDGNGYSFYKFEEVVSNVINIESLKDVIKELRMNGNKRLIDFVPSDFYLEDGSLAYKLKSKLLSMHNKFLEKVYKEEIIDGVCYIFGYITCINMYTGDLKIIKVNNFGIFSEETEILLEKKGYKNYVQSFLNLKENAEYYSLSRKKN